MHLFHHETCTAHDGKMTEKTEQLVTIYFQFQNEHIPLERTDLGFDTGGNELK